MDQLNISSSRVSGRHPVANNSPLLASLLQEANGHPALNHVWLDSIAQHKYPSMMWALRDYACEYHGYASAFPVYLGAVIDKLEDENHQKVLRHNLDEEQGKLDAIDANVLKTAGIDVQAVDGVSHPRLYKRFCSALDIADEDLKTPSPAALMWKQQLLAYINDATPAAAVGAIGLGTESIVKPMYTKLLQGIRQLGTLDRKDYVFFELHCIVDDQHALDLNRIAYDLIASDDNLTELRAGMFKALDLRNQFWNHLHVRATKGPTGKLAS
jgi:pyrroloquinoline quinone (PQQ) biosynthesis protein C